MPRTRLMLLVAVLLVSACQSQTQPPAAPRPAGAPAAAPAGVPVALRASASGRAEPPATLPGRAPSKLAHDGGIVYMAPLEAITDAAKKTSAATLGTELGATLRAERTMRDAELLAAEGAVGTHVAAYRLASAEDDADEAKEPAQGSASPTPRPSRTPEAEAPEDDDEVRPATSPRGSAEKQDEADSQGDEKDEDKREQEGGKQDRAKDRDQEDERDEEAAKAAWQQLSSDQRDAVKRSLEGRESKLLAKLTGKLARKKSAFAKQGGDAVATGADGGRDVTTTYVVANAAGSRTITVTRKFDRAGTLVQSRQTLEGTVDGVLFSAARTRTINPDGSLKIVSDATLTLAGQARTIHWEKSVAPDGVLTASGQLKRADGTVVALSAAGTEDGVETIAGQDAGVAIKLVADAADGSATATLEAGAAGSATVKLDADDEDDDEGDVDDDAAEDEKTDVDDDEAEDDDKVARQADG